MASDRATLHKSKLSEFTKFAKESGYVQEEEKGTYEVLRLRSSYGNLLIFYLRDRTDHITVSSAEAIRLVNRFVHRGRT